MIVTTINHPNFTEKQVKATQRGPFAIHRTVGSFTEWTVTHIMTGRAVSVCCCRASALGLSLALCALEVDWNFTLPRQVTPKWPKRLLPDMNKTLAVKQSWRCPNGCK